MMSDVEKRFEKGQCGRGELAVAVAGAQAVLATTASFFSSCKVQVLAGASTQAQMGKWREGANRKESMGHLTVSSTAPYCH